MGPTAGNRLVPPALTVACPQANHRLGFCPTCQPRGTRPCSGHPQAPGWARPLPGPPHGPRPQSEWEGCRLCSGASSGSPLTLQTQAAPPSRPLPDQSHTDFGPGRWGQHDTRVKGSGARPRGGLESPRHLGACSLSATCPPAPHGDSTRGGESKGPQKEESNVFCQHPQSGWPRSALSSPGPQGQGAGGARAGWAQVPRRDKGDSPRDGHVVPEDTWQPQRIQQSLPLGDQRGRAQSRPRLPSDLVDGSDFQGK